MCFLTVAKRFLFARINMGYHHFRKTAVCGVAKRVCEMIYGYARVSTKKKDGQGEFVQTTALQIDALTAAGVAPENIYEDRISGGKWSRPGLDALLSVVKAGDEILVWKIDRLGRSAREILNTAHELRERGVSVQGVTDGVITKGTMGRLALNIMAAFAELERETISERVTAGIAASRAAGGRIGRNKAMSHGAREEAARAVASGESVASVARRYGVDRATVYRVLKSKNS